MSGENPDIYQNTGTYQPDGMPAYDPMIIDEQWGDNAAEENQSALARHEYEDYKARIRPVENALINQIGNRGVYRSEVDRARQSVADSYAGGQGEYARNLSRYGAQPSAAERKQQQRTMGLSKAKAVTEAANRTRSAVKNRNMRVMGGGLAPKSPRKKQE